MLATPKDDLYEKRMRAGADRYALPGKRLQLRGEILGDLLLSGEKESPIMPLRESLAIHEVMDSIREQWGMQYPMDLD